MKLSDNNRLSLTFPEIAKEWHTIKNRALTPDKVTKGSGKKVWWLCPKRHEYQAQVSSRTRLHSGCPYCAGKKSTKNNNLMVFFPKLSKEWHPTKNSSLTPNDVTKASGKKVWWLCSNGHEYIASISNRALKNTGCPYCLGRKASKDNNLALLFPQLAKEWHPNKNSSLTPEEVTKSSNKKAWWLCPKKHQYYASINARTSNNTGCPYCCGKKVSGYNSLEVLFPEIAREWHPTKNAPLTPTDVTKGSSKKVWWLCFKGHEYCAQIFNRASQKTGCPYCSGRKSSKDNSLATHFPNIAREWHPTKNSPLTPEDVAKCSNKKMWWLCSNGHTYNAAVNNRVLKKTGCPYCTGRTASAANKLTILFPEIANEWHPTKNDMLTPYEVTKHSSKKVWWLCPYGHEYNISVANRTSLHTNCPYCAGNKVSMTNNLATHFPKIANEWHPTKNGALLPKDIAKCSGKKVWWLCPNEHEYLSRISSRTHSNMGCPYCAGKRTSTTDNLKIHFPKIAKEWHPTKNGVLLPNNVTKRSGKKVWWLCPNKHEYLSRISSRTTCKTGCHSFAILGKAVARLLVLDGLCPVQYGQPFV
ncbi:zinc-ribbon domain-containing protein [Patescibacteria group bacterium]|nr:zinc-ribbon domain-containing protein [Patescibacteria group bacterium]